MEGGKSVKDKAMAARMKGEARTSKVATNGVERFTCRTDAEYRTTMRCPMCHGTVSVGLLDAHLRSHMGGSN